MDFFWYVLYIYIYILYIYIYRERERERHTYISYIYINGGNGPGGLKGKPQFSMASAAVPETGPEKGVEKEVKWSQNEASGDTKIVQKSEKVTSRGSPGEVLETYPQIMWNIVLFLGCRPLQNVVYTSKIDGFPFLCQAHFSSILGVDFRSLWHPMAFQM